MVDVTLNVPMPLLNVTAEIRGARLHYDRAGGNWYWCGIDIYRILGFSNYKISHRNGFMRASLVGAAS